MINTKRALICSQCKQRIHSLFLPFGLTGSISFNNIEHILVLKMKMHSLQFYWISKQSHFLTYNSRANWINVTRIQQVIFLLELSLQLNISNTEMKYYITPFSRYQNIIYSCLKERFITVYKIKIGKLKEKITVYPAKHRSL